VENRFQSLPFKCNLQRYTEGHKSEKQPASVAAAAIWFCVQIKGDSEVGRYKRVCGATKTVCYQMCIETDVQVEFS
jgi:hypothetical protein